MFDWIRRHASTLAGAVCMSAFTPAIDFGQHVEWMQMLFVIVFLVLSLGIHEAAHAWVAYKCGDSTAKDLGRITLNPIPHIDPFMTLILPGVMFVMSNGQMAFGGAKPVPVDYTRLRHPLRDMSLVALAGPASNFLLAIVFLLAWKAGVFLGNYPENSLLPNVLWASMVTNLMLAAFNMLPIPPLDGSRVMTWLLPSQLRRPYVALESIGLVIVILVWQLGPIRHAVFGAIDTLYGFLFRVTGGIW
jgi:Zn-dependent protease